MKKFKYYYHINNEIRKRDLSYDVVLPSHIINGRGYDCRFLIKRLGIVPWIHSQFPDYWLISYSKDVFIPNRLENLNTLIVVIHINVEKQYVLVNYSLDYEIFAKC